MYSPFNKNMGNSSKEEEEFGSFEVTYSPSEMYSLLNFLNHLSISMEEKTNRMIAQNLAKKVQDEIASDSFTQALEEEIEYKEEMFMQDMDSFSNLDESLKRGVQ